MPTTKSQLDVCGATAITNLGTFGTSPSMRQRDQAAASRARTPHEPRCRVAGSRAHEGGGASREERCGIAFRSTLPPDRMMPTRRSAHVERPRRTRGGRERARGLDHELHALPEEAHRLDQLRRRSTVMTSCTCAQHQRKRERAERLRCARRRRSSAGCRRVCSVLGAEGARRIVARRGLDADHADAGREVRARRSRSRRAAPRRRSGTKSVVERPHVLDQFLGRGALARDHVRDGRTAGSRWRPSRPRCARRHPRGSRPRRGRRARLRAP